MSKLASNFTRHQCLVVFDLSVNSICGSPLRLAKRRLMHVTMLLWGPSSFPPFTFSRLLAIAHSVPLRRCQIDLPRCVLSKESGNYRFRHIGVLPSRELVYLSIAFDDTPDPVSLVGAIFQLSCFVHFTLQSHGRL